MARSGGKASAPMTAKQRDRLIKDLEFARRQGMGWVVRDFNSCLREIDRLNAELTEARELYEANHG